MTKDHFLAKVRASNEYSLIGKQIFQPTERDENNSTGLFCVFLRFEKSAFFMPKSFFDNCICKCEGGRPGEACDEDVERANGIANADCREASRIGQKKRRHALCQTIALVERDLIRRTL